MKTRIGKIARLPFEVREQLNRRLQNGETGGSILNWLNELPETLKVLSERFDAKSINKQNLSDWRHGGYQDWLRHQDRHEWAQRISEQGEQLHAAERSIDFYDSFSRVLMAEMARDLESLHDMTNRAERSKRLHQMARDLSRLQNSFNHSKRVELEWVKRNDKYEDGDTDVPPVTGQAVHPATEISNNAPSSNSTVKPSQAESRDVALIHSPLDPPKIHTVIRNIRHRQCGYGCVCKDCHPDDGEYPYAQALKDAESKEPHSSEYWHRGNEWWLVFHTDCNCYCGCEKSLAWERRRLVGSVGKTPTDSGLSPSGSDSIMRP